jgi:hypothetical protein
LLAVLSKKKAKKIRQLLSLVGFSSPVASGLASAGAAAQDAMRPSVRVPRRPREDAAVALSAS